MGDLSTHFSRSEFACHHCRQVVIAPGLVNALERLRAIVGRPLRVVSGYRCPTHNRHVGGARNSRHLHGDAVDLEPGYATPTQVKQAGFGSLGINRKGQVIHADLRPRPVGVFHDGW